MLRKSKYEEINLEHLTTFPMSELERKVELGEFSKPLKAGATFTDFINSLPHILAAKDIIKLSEMIANAYLNEKAVIVMFGGHVIKTGLASIIIDFMKRGIVTTLATHGASIIHDSEIALFGRTSEDVAEGLADGSFGMSRDTANFINGAIADPDNQNLGFGEALGGALVASNAPCAHLSLLCNAYQLNVPFCVHVALGTDIIHQHPTANGEAIGRASLRDFRIFSREVGRLDSGGVVLNFGSAVILPEVFLKAVSVSRNLGYPVHGFTSANFDMFTHYRPTQNVLKRPTLTGGKWYNFIGHHEINIPLLFALVNEKIAEAS